MTDKVKLEVRAYPLDNQQGNTLAFANVGINDKLAISGIRVMRGANGTFVSMPQSRDKDGGYHNIVSIKDYDVMKEIKKEILAEYRKIADMPPEQRGYPKMEPTGMAGETALEVNVLPLKERQGGILAHASVTVDNLVEINGVRLISCEKGAFMAMPQSQDKDGGLHDIVYPVMKGLCGEMENALVDEFGKAQSRDRSDDRGDFSGKLAEGARKSAEYTANKASQPQEMAAKRSPGIGG
jgi:DNA-binding cell septation regulator SpoVG